MRLYRRLGLLLRIGSYLGLDIVIELELYLVQGFRVSLWLELGLVLGSYLVLG